MQFKKPDISIQDILNGNIFTKGWMKRQYKLFVLIFVLLIIYIFAGYQSQKQQARLADLSRDLQDARYEYLTINAELVEMSRQSVISKRLKEAGSNVKESTTPAIRIN